MAKLNLTLPYGELAITGKQVTFIAPCESAGLTHIIIQNDEFELVDSSGNNIIAGAFMSGAMVSVILNVENKKAYIQNADINYQLKESFVGKSEKIVNLSSATIQSVPSESIPRAKVTKLGGITRKCANIIDYTKGKEVISHNGIVFTNNGDGSFTVNGTSTDYAMYYIHDTNTLINLKAGTYTLSGAKSGVTIHLFPQNWSAMYGVTDGSKSFTFEGDMTLGVVIRIAPETTINNVVVYPMLNEGETALSYEPYYEGLRSSSITSIKSEGANLFDYNRFSKSTTHRGITFTNNGDGSVTVNGAHDNSENLPAIYYLCQTNDRLITEENTTYTVSGIVKNKVGISMVDKEGKMTANIGKNFTITTKEGSSKNSYYVYLYANVGETVENVTVYPMLTKGTEVKPYKPYSGFSGTFIVPEVFQSIDGYGEGISDTCFNYIDIDKKQFIKRVGKVDMGTLEWEYDGPNSQATVNLNDMAQGGAVLCAKYNNTDWLSWEEGISTNELTVSVIDYVNSDIESFKTAVSGEILYYELAVPEIIDISDIISTDNFIDVEDSGSLTFNTEYGYNVPCEITYFPKPTVNLCVCTVVGDLIGTASRAICDEHGNVIPQTYVSKSSALVDSESKAVKFVPGNSATFAKVNMIGGMTRKCRNLIPYPYADTTKTVNGITFTDNGDGTVTVNGTATDEADFMLSRNFEIKSGAIMSGAEGGSSTTFEIQAYLDGGNYISTNAGFNKATHDFIATFLRIRIRSGYTANNLVFKPMLNFGNTAKPYESYFEGLRSAKVTEIESIGANLTTAKEVCEGADRYLETVVDGRNCIRFTSGKNVKKTPITFKPNTQYTVSFYAKGEDFNGATTSNYGFTFYYEDGTTTSIYVNPNAPWTLFTLTSQSGKTVTEIGIASREYRAYVYLDTDTFMLNEGTTALPYKPYTKTTLLIPEAVQSLVEYGAGLDESLYNYIDFEKKQFVKRVGCVDIGSLTYTHRESNGRQIFTTILADLPLCKNTSVPINALCDKFTAVPTDVTWINGDMGYQYGNSRTLDFVANDFIDGALFKEAMSGVMLYYELETPEVIDLSDILLEDSISVANDGTVTMVNEYDYDMPNSISFYKSGNEVVDSRFFVGELKGRATYANKAKSAEKAGEALCDGNGNNIASTYAHTPIISQVDIEAGVTPLADGQSYHVYE